MKISVIEARDLPEAWFLCLRKTLAEGYEYKIERGSYAGLDMLFGNQHDLVISVHSMTIVRNGNYPVDLLHRQVVPCNHFAYFSSE